MNRKPIHNDDSWSNDPVWKLLDQAPPARSGPLFVRDTVRAARLSDQAKPWWQRLLSPAPFAGFATATAAVVWAAIWCFGPAHHGLPHATALDAQQAARIQDIAESETLIAAVDHLEDFSDPELVSMIGF